MPPGYPETRCYFVAIIWDKHCSPCGRCVTQEVPGVTTPRPWGREGLALLAVSCVLHTPREKRKETGPGTDGLGPGELGTGAQLMLSVNHAILGRAVHAGGRSSKDHEPPTVGPSPPTFRATCSRRPGGRPEQPRAGRSHTCPHVHRGHEWCPGLPQESPLCGLGPAWGTRGSGLCSPPLVRRHHQVERKPRPGRAEGPSPPGGLAWGGPAGGGREGPSGSHRRPPSWPQAQTLLCSGTVAPREASGDCQSLRLLPPSRGASLEAPARLGRSLSFRPEGMAPQGLSQLHRASRPHSPGRGARHAFQTPLAVGSARTGHSPNPLPCGFEDKPAS